MNDANNLLWPEADCLDEASTVRLLAAMSCGNSLNNHNDIAGFLAVRKRLATVYCGPIP